MAQVSYNSVQLPYSYLTEFRQEPVLDDVGQTDWCLNKYSIAVQCVINANYLISAVATSIAGANPNPVLIMQAIRNTLSHPRKALSVIINGQEMIPQNQGGNTGTVDAKNGPIVTGCNFVELMDTTFLLTFSVVAHYWENAETVVTGSSVTTTNKIANNVIFNRWTETVEIDKLNYTRRVRQGKYAIRSDNVDGVTADQLRSKMAVVALPFGFLRESSSYTISPDGLSIAYRVADKEVYRLPPDPAFTAQGWYAENTVIQGALRHGEVYVKLEGGRDTDRVDLVETCIAVAASKLYLNGASLIINGGFVGRGDNMTILEHALVKMDMYENKVECSMKVMIKTRKSRVQGTTLVSNQFSLDTPGSESEEALRPSPPYTLRGSAFFLLKAAAYYDPNLAGTIATSTSDYLSSDNPQIPAGDSVLSAGKLPGTAGVSPET